MRHIPAILAMVLVVAACNLSDRFKKTSSGNSNSSSSSNPSKIGDEPVEKPQPTAGQTAALANGAEAKWDEQGISWTVPPGWKKQSSSTNSFQYGANGAFLIVSISPMSGDFPTEISLRGFHEGAKVR